MKDTSFKHLQAIIGILFTFFIFTPFLILFILSDHDLDLQTLLTLFIAIIILILYLLFLTQTLLHDRKEYYLTYGLLIGIFASLIAGVDKIQVLSHFFNNSDQPTIISLVLWSITYLFIYFFFESLYSIEVNNKRFFLVIVFFMISIISHLSILVAPMESSVFWNWADLGYDGLGIIIFIFGIWVLYKSYKQVGGETTELLQMFGLSFILLGFILGFLIDFSFVFVDISGFDPSTFLESYFGDLVKVIGIILFTFSYIREIDYIYRLPFPIYSIIFFKSDSGLSLNVTNFNNVSQEKTIKLDENLITGTISAIMTLLKEGLGSKGFLKTIISSDQSILVSSNDEASIAVITSRPTKILQNSLKMALDEFTINFKHNFHVDKAIEISEFSNTKLILKKAFPYLNIQN